MREKRVQRKRRSRLLEVVNQAVKKQDYNIFRKWMERVFYGKH